MDNKERDIYIKAIEELNLENIKLLKSKEYSLGKNILKIKKLLSKLQIIDLVKEIINRNRRMKVSKYRIMTNNEDEKKYIKTNDVSNYKIAVYACITGRI